MIAMPTYIALLRAVNVGGRFYKMADLRRHLADSGLHDVETYIQTGNVRFRTPMRSVAKVESHCESVLGEHCRFDVPTIVFSPGELQEVYDDALALTPSFPRAEGQRRYVTFFKAGHAPTGDVAAQMEAWDAEGESAFVRGRAVHVWLDHMMHEATFFGAFKKALAPGTNRDLKVVATLAERWGQPRRG
jgi:uncharacterized protein (DUF1697 family)